MDTSHPKVKEKSYKELVIEGNYSGTPIFEYNTDFIGLILKTEKI